MIRKSPALVSLAASVLAVAVACGGSDQAPQAPTAVSTPTPAPSPTATPSVVAQTCTLPPMPECSPRGGPSCCEQGYDVLGEFVVLAIQRVQAERPELFDGNKLRNKGDANEIVELIAKALRERHGLCAEAGNPIEDEVAVKRTNDFNEQFDVIIGDGESVNIHGYQVTCRPSRF
ncbi:MAG: hypothetical protein AB7O37_01560 [Vicinamibacteria bacterium]